MTKTVSISKFSEWAGLDRISIVVHEMKCIFRELNKDDFGIDGEIEVVVPKANEEGYETTGGIIKVQAKSGKSYVKEDSADSFSTPLDKKDIEYFSKLNFPIIYIVYHPVDNKLYWKDIKTYIKKTPSIFRAPHKAIYDKSKDEFSVNSYEHIFGLAQVSKPRISFDNKERLYTNLLPVKQLPNTVYLAPTIYNRYRQVRESIEGYLPPFDIKSGTLVTFDDLKDDRSYLRPFCDYNSVESLSLDEWIEEYKNDGVHLLNQMLAKQIRECGLRFHKEKRRNYFPRGNDSRRLEFKREWYNVRTNKKNMRTVVKYHKYGYDEFWRHLSFNHRFILIGNKWNLQIIPNSLYTIDGFNLFDSDKVGSYTTRIRAREYNIQSLTNVFFIADVLSNGNNEIKVRMYDKLAMIIEKVPMTAIANFSISDDPAIYEEQDESQLDFTSLFPDMFEDKYEN